MMMRSETRLLMRQEVAIILMVAIIAAVVGAVIGVGRVYAEVLQNQYVPGAGNVATAGTVGWYNGGELNSYGTSTSTTTLYYIFAGIRIWHSPSCCPNQIMDQDSQAWYYSRGGNTNVVQSVGYGDVASTRSAFRYSSSPGTGSSVYYTSYPDNLGSCSTFWYTGNDC
ncbi:MAG: hypothetical protein D6791_08360 [Chloroflexi bacterium]|nr:MAG: hypothetical protein D6791_08360 [Chloroflexota bacterium]